MAGPIEAHSIGNVDRRLVEGFRTFRREAIRLKFKDPCKAMISDYRTAGEQAALRQRWDSGDREGLAARPATPEGSRHVRGTAFDLIGTPEELRAWGLIWEYMGGRWGGHWVPPDPGHFDLG